MLAAFVDEAIQMDTVSEPPVVTGGAPAEDTATGAGTEEEEEEEHEDDDDDDDDEDDDDDDEEDEDVSPSEVVAEHADNDVTVMSDESVGAGKPANEATAVADEVQTLNALTAALEDVEAAFRKLEKMPQRVKSESSQHVSSASVPAANIATTASDDDHTATPDGSTGALAAEASAGKSESASVLSGDELKAMNALIAALGEVKTAFLKLSEMLATPAFDSQSTVVPEMENPTEVSSDRDAEFEVMENEADKGSDDGDDEDDSETGTVRYEDGDSNLPVDDAGESSEGTVTVDVISAKEARALDAITAALRHVAAAFYNIKRLSSGKQATPLEESLFPAATDAGVSPDSAVSGVHSPATPNVSDLATANKYLTGEDTITKTASGTAPPSEEAASSTDPTSEGALSATDPPSEEAASSADPTSEEAASGTDSASKEAPSGTDSASKEAATGADPASEEDTSPSSGAVVDEEEDDDDDDD